MVTASEASNNLLVASLRSAVKESRFTPVRKEAALSLPNLIEELPRAGAGGDGI
jgi:hypothetical protein